MIRIDNVAIATKEIRKHSSWRQINWAAIACIVIVAAFWMALFAWLTE